MKTRTNWLIAMVILAGWPASVVCAETEPLLVIVVLSHLGTIYKVFNNQDLQEIELIYCFAIEMTQIHKCPLYSVSRQIFDLWFSLWAK
ncbi:MAG TPA: hypothetical protein VMW72_04490 [Sedimentisphaerales bacterium]|nr:hypothetical protein [Sedimentisphaerales bacterium]